MDLSLFLAEAQCWLFCHYCIGLQATAVRQQGPGSILAISSKMADEASSQQRDTWRHWSHGAISAVRLTSQQGSNDAAQQATPDDASGSTHSDVTTAQTDQGVHPPTPASPQLTQHADCALDPCQGHCDDQPSQDAGDYPLAEEQVTDSHSLAPFIAGSPRATELHSLQKQLRHDAIQEPASHTLIQDTYAHRMGQYGLNHRDDPGAPSHVSSQNVTQSQGAPSAPSHIAEAGTSSVNPPQHHQTNAAVSDQVADAAEHLANVTLTAEQSAQPHQQQQQSGQGETRLSSDWHSKEMSSHPLPGQPSPQHGQHSSSQSQAGEKSSQHHSAASARHQLLQPLQRITAAKQDLHLSPVSQQGDLQLQHSQRQRSPQQQSQLEQYQPQQQHQQARQQWLEQQQQPTVVEQQGGLAIGASESAEQRKQKEMLHAKVCFVVAAVCCMACG